MNDLNPLENLSKIQDLVDLNDFMDDEDFAAACELALKCMVNPNITPATAQKALLQMQAYAFKFKMMGNVYMTIKQGKAGTDENKRKNVYFSAAEECKDLVAALKYSAKEAF